MSKDTATFAAFASRTARTTNSRQVALRLGVIPVRCTTFAARRYAQSTSSGLIAAIADPERSYTTRLGRGARPSSTKYVPTRSPRVHRTRDTSTPCAPAQPAQRNGHVGFRAPHVHAQLRRVLQWDARWCRHPQHCFPNGDHVRHRHVSRPRPPTAFGLRSDEQPAGRVWVSQGNQREPKVALAELVPLVPGSGRRN